MRTVLYDQLKNILAIASFLLFAPATAFPESANSIELAILMEKFLPTHKTDAIYWDHESENPLIEWEADGFHDHESNPVFFKRTGKVHVTAAGKRFWTLKSRKVPVPWEVSMAGLKKGVSEIHFNPSEASWGSFASGNEFDFLETMAVNKKFNLQYICTTEESGVSIEDYYHLQYNDSRYVINHKKLLSASNYDQSVMLYLIDPILPPDCRESPPDERADD